MQSESDEEDGYLRDKDLLAVVSKHATSSQLDFQGC